MAIAKAKLLQLNTIETISDSGLASMIGTPIRSYGMTIGVVTRAWVEKDWVMIEFKTEE